MEKEWLGDRPTECDVCMTELKGVFVDGATKRGMWAIMCPGCHRRVGTGLGTGRGQMYTLDEKSGRWLKTQG